MIFFTDNKLLKTLRVILFACLVVPVLASKSFLFPFTSPKGFAFRILIELAAVLFFYLVLKEKLFLSFRLRSSGEKSLKLVLSFAIFIFFLLNFLSSFSGIDFHSSFWGTIDRMAGFWGLLHFVAFFWMLAVVFKTKKDWQFLFKISLGASFLVSLSGILQVFSGFGVLMPQTGRAAGLIGNAGFLATYLLFNLFFGVYLFWDEIKSRNLSFKKFWQSKLVLAYAIVCVFNLWALFLSGTRGAILGLGAGILFFILCGVFLFPIKQKRRYFGAVLVFFVILAVSFFLFRDVSVVKNNSTLSRLANISLSDKTAQSRLLLWQSSWQAWQERPILGWGPENNEAALNKYFSPELNKYEAWYDHSHNFIFDYGVSGGWLGLFSYIGIFAAVFLILIKRRKDFVFFAVFGSLFAAYLVQNLFIFDSFISYLMLFFVLAFVAGFFSPPFEKGGLGGILSYSKKIIFTIFVFFLIFSIYAFNLKPVFAARLANNLLALPVDDPAYMNGVNNLVKSENWASDEIIYQVVMDYLDRINHNQQLTQNENFYKLVSDALNNIIERSPLQSRYQVALAWLDLYFSGQSAERIEKALILGENIEKLSPAKKDAYLIQTAAYAISGRQKEAKEVVERAQKINNELGKIVDNYLSNLK